MPNGNNGHRKVKDLPGTVPDDLQPHDIAAEEAVLGSLLLDRDAIIHVATFLDGSDFFIERHGWIFDAVRGLYADNAPTDLVTLCDELSKRGQLKEIGGSAYLTGLINQTPTSTHVVWYAKIVQRKSVQRKLMDVAGDIARRAWDNQDEADILLADAEDMILGISGRQADNKTKFALDLAESNHERLERLKNSDNNLVGLPTGLTDLDKLLGGLQRSDVIVIAGRPGMGKTSLATQIAKYTGLKFGTRSLIFSLEMSGEQLFQRLTAADGGIDVSRLRRGDIREHEWHAVLSSETKLSRLPLAVVDAPQLTPALLRSRALRHKAIYGLDLLIVDYLQLMNSDHRGQNRHQEVADISRACKNLARELNIPVIVLSQLNRNVEYGANKRPTLSHLRESGAIEADADVIIFLYRDEIYNPDTEQAGVAEIIVAKHRNGPTGVVMSFFRKQFTEFVDLAVKKYQFGQAM